MTLNEGPDHHPSPISLGAIGEDVTITATRCCGLFVLSHNIQRLALGFREMLMDIHWSPVPRSACVLGPSPTPASSPSAAASTVQPSSSTKTPNSTPMAPYSVLGIMTLAIIATAAIFLVYRNRRLTAAALYMQLEADDEVTRISLSEMIIGICLKK